MEKLLEIKNLSKKFEKSKDFLGKAKGFVYALNDFSLDIYKGETVGLVGESGCGKSTAGRCILNLIKPDEGEVNFKGQNILNLNKKDFKNIQKNMQIIFQNPYSSLNPRMNVKDILAEPLELNTNLSKKEIDYKIDKILGSVGLSTNIKTNMPHEFSGGQRQRIVIARALILNPEFIVADEPISALDVSIQAQILKLLQDLKEEYNLTYFFISHDLRTVENFCDRVAVMYLGEVVELAKTQELFANPLHPYSQALLKSVPKIDFSNKTGIAEIKGEPISNERQIAGCNYCERCTCVTEICKNLNPKTSFVNTSHFCKCHLVK